MHAGYLEATPLGSPGVRQKEVGFGGLSSLKEVMPCKVEVNSIYGSSSESAFSKLPSQVDQVRLSPSSSTATPPSVEADHLFLPAPPPAYAAPLSFQCFQEKAPAPPPVAAPAGLEPVRIDGLMTDTWPERLEEKKFSRHIAKNTFIDIPEDHTPLQNEQSQTCAARLSNSDASFFPQSPGQPPGPLSPGAVSTSSKVQGLTPKSQKSPKSPKKKTPNGSSTVSVGSAAHGVFDSEGKPTCQPCAWFFKESGCLNGRSCRYCHLCPQGELKNRKKTKVAKLRKEDAEAAAEAAASSGSQELQPGPVLHGLQSADTAGCLPPGLLSHTR